VRRSPVTCQASASLMHNSPGGPPLHPGFVRQISRSPSELVPAQKADLKWGTLAPARISALVCRQLDRVDV
jgi:hypothetical protein